MIQVKEIVFIPNRIGMALCPDLWYAVVRRLVDSVLISFNGSLLAVRKDDILMER